MSVGRTAKPLAAEVTEQPNAALSNNLARAHRAESPTPAFRAGRIAGEPAL